MAVELAAGGAPVLPLLVAPTLLAPMGVGAGWAAGAAGGSWEAAAGGGAAVGAEDVL